MRHGKKFNHLGRTKSHRKAMLANMACSLIESKRINTTVAKAKALRQYVEPLLTKSKDDSTHSRRVVFGYLQSKDAVSELFRDVAPNIAERNGGYTRILKTGNRLGDNADMCFIELVDFNETYVQDKNDKKTTTRRSRRGGKPSEVKVAADTATAEAPVGDVVEDATEVVVEEVKSEVETKEEVIEVEAKEVEETPEAVVEETVEQPEATTDPVEEKKVEAKAETTEEPKAESKEAEEKKEEEKSEGDDEEKKD
jgi:large subunit ribosomal protein L17